jgi:hypothetical protein
MNKLSLLAGLVLAFCLFPLTPARAQCSPGQNESASRSVTFPATPINVYVDGVLLGYERVPPILVGTSTVYVEMKALLNALGMGITNYEPASYRVTAVKGDLKIVTCMGTINAPKTVFGLPSGNVTMSPTPFHASGYDKTLVPVEYASQALGARVTPFNSTTRRVDITSGRAYHFDYANTYIMYTENRQLGAEGGTYTCPTGTTFDLQSKYCMQNLNGINYVRGPFPTRYRNHCASLGYTNCATDTWTKAQALHVIDTVGLTGSTVNDVLAVMKSNPEVYGVPYENNDIVSVGLFSQTGARQQDFARSEEPMVPFVMSARRQTDSMIKSLYLLLPSTVRTTYAFLHPDRVAQTPEAYIPYIQKKRKAYVVGTFMGLTDVNKADKKNAVLLRHERELFKLKTTLALLNAMGIQVEGIFYSLGDTIQTDKDVPEIPEIRNDLQARYNRILTAAGYGALARPMTFGGDELMAVAFAKSLNVSYPAYIRISNPLAQHRYDGLRTTRTLVDQKLPEVGLTEVTTRGTAAFELHILTRDPTITERITTKALKCGSLTVRYTVEDWLYNGLSDTFGHDCADDRTKRVEHDTAFMSVLNAYSATDRARTFIMDARTHNGAWDNASAPRTCDWLGYSGWGTGANNIGMSMAIAKILHHTNNRGGSTVAKRMFLEAVAHDVYANGYQDAQRGQFRADLSRLFNITFNHHPGYTVPDQTYRVFNYLTEFASSRMATHFSGTSCIPTGVTHPFKFTAQFWRTFESEVHMWPFAAGESLVPGMHRTGTVPGATLPMWQVLDPNGRGAPSVTRVDMNYLLAE